MPDLQSCYFCGAPDDVQEYAVVPPRLSDDERSVPLCEQCKTKLLRVMEPLIDQVENGEAESGSPETEPATESGEGVTMSSGPAQSGDAVDNDVSDAADGGSDTGSAAPDGPAGTASDDTPPSYQRAMRMLSNRPFPVSRTEAESMLAAAYDLEREEVDAVIDYAIEDGRLTEANGQLREP